MKSNRRHDRFIKRLETEFTAGQERYRGISSDLSLNGLFIRTNHPCQPGTIVDITLHLPDGTTSRLRGVVRRSMKTPVVSVKNGMGIKILDMDEGYRDVLAMLSESGGAVEDKDEDAVEDSTPKEKGEGDGIVESKSSLEVHVLVCSRCGEKNLVASTKLTRGPKCDVCGFPLLAT